MNMRNMRQAFIFIVSMLLTVCKVAVAQSSGYVYVVRSWDEAAQKVVEKDTTCTDYRMLTASDNVGSLPTGNYVVSGKVTLSSRIYFTGDSRLILLDGCELVAKKGISIGENATLSIHAQKVGTGRITAHSGKYTGIGSDEGKLAGYLVIHGGVIDAKATDSNHAGIGGAKDGGIKGVTIYGGEVSASADDDAAGIGKGESGIEGQHEAIRIYGGKVTAKGAWGGAGIGGGRHRGNGPVFIYGGEVQARGGDFGAGIGGGAGGHQDGPVKIYGGTVKAFGGYGAAGIGAGPVPKRDEGDVGPDANFDITWFCSHDGKNGGEVFVSGGYVYAEGGYYYNNMLDCVYLGAAIGGSYGGNGGNVTITGGVVCLKIDGHGKKNRGDDGKACPIGHGDRASKAGTLSLYEGMAVSYGKSESDLNWCYYNERKGKCQEKSKKAYVRIAVCDHGGAGPVPVSSQYHAIHCYRCCIENLPELHECPPRGGKCSKCSYVAPYIYAVRYMFPDFSLLDTSDDIYLREYRNYDVQEGRVFYMPECAKGLAPDGYVFAGWALKDEGTDTGGFEVGEGEELLAPGTGYTVTEDVEFIARYQNANPAMPGTAHAVYCEENGTLYFLKTTLPLLEGGEWDGRRITSIWSGEDVTASPLYSVPGWSSVASGVTRVVFDPSFASARPVSCGFWFDRFKNLAEIDGIGNLNTSETTSMAYMFYGCESLATVDVGGFDVSKVGEADHMFASCYELRTIYCDEAWPWDDGISNSMFSSCFELEGTSVYDREKADGSMANPETGYFTPRRLLVLRSDADNNETIDGCYGMEKDVAVRGLTLYKDGLWDTLCLPFDVDLGAEGCPLAGAEARELSSVLIDNNTLTLNFSEPATVLRASVPYIIRWADTGESIQGPTFNNVTVDVASGDFDNGILAFKGTYASRRFTKADNILFLGADNKFHHPKNAKRIDAFHAYLQTKPQVHDVNGDGVVNVTDITFLVNCILGNDNGDGMSGSVDVNGDGFVSVTDVTELVNFILYGSNILNVVITGAEGLTFGD